MGNSTTTAAGKTGRTFSIDPVGGGRESNSPKSDEAKFDFPIGGKKKTLLCYQSSIEYASDDNYDEFKGRPRASTISQSSSIDENALPTVFKWEGGGTDVYITGTFSKWQPIKMCHSHSDFVAIIDVPEGVHKYKFIVDGTETVNNNANIDETSMHNVIQVNKRDFEVFEALAMDLASNTTSNASTGGSPPGSYSNKLPSMQKTEHTAGHPSGSGPPILPPHLLQVILNNPNVHGGEPTLLPQPNHVMLNHLYALSIKDGVMVLSCTHRYRKKYVTTLLYKPI